MRFRSWYYNFILTENWNFVLCMRDNSICPFVRNHDDFTAICGQELREQNWPSALFLSSIRVTLVIVAICELMFAEAGK